MRLKQQGTANDNAVIRRYEFVWVSCKVYFSRSTISLVVLFVISFYLLIRSLSRSYDCYELQHYRLRSLAVLVSLLPDLCIFKIQIFGAVIVFSFSIALALRKANFVSRNVGH